MTRLPRRAVLAGLSATLSAPAVAQGLSRPDVIIGWTPWSDAEVVTKLAARVLREGMGADVELTLADIEAQFRAMSRGEIDAMLMSWEPGLHAPYLRRYGADLVDLGALYRGTIGLAVPGWVDAAQIAAIPDLSRPDIVAALEGRIVGIDPGAGLMATTRDAMRAYALDAYRLQEGTGPSMVREIALAQRRDKPVVVTAWRPHMKFALYDMRYLDDPQGLFAEASTIHARGNAGFFNRAPEIAGILGRITLDPTEIEQIMVAARETGIDTALGDWMAAHPDRIAAWLG